jgi:hypothetical protein
VGLRNPPPRRPLPLLSPRTGPSRPRREALPAGRGVVGSWGGGPDRPPGGELGPQRRPDPAGQLQDDARGEGPHPEGVPGWGFVGGRSPAAPAAAREPSASGSPRVAAPRRPPGALPVPPPCPSDPAPRGRPRRSSHRRPTGRSALRPPGPGCTWRGSRRGGARAGEETRPGRGSAPPRRRGPRSGGTPVRRVGLRAREPGRPRRPSPDPEGVKGRASPERSGAARGRHAGGAEGRRRAGAHGGRWVRGGGCRAPRSTVSQDPSSGGA